MNINKFSSVTVTATISPAPRREQSPNFSVMLEPFWSPDGLGELCVLSVLADPIL
jgi:hypothetical protein